MRALAEGGLVTRPTLALLGERGPEQVIPQRQLAAVGGGPRVETKLDQLNHNVTMLREDFAQLLDPRRQARAWTEAIAFAGT